MKTTGIQSGNYWNSYIHRTINQPEQNIPPFRTRSAFHTILNLFKVLTEQERYSDYDQKTDQSKQPGLPIIQSAR